MYKYYELLTDEDVKKVKNEVRLKKLHPKQAKVNLAKIIVSQYHGEKEALKQAEEFDRAFKDKGFPNDIMLEKINVQSYSVPIVDFLLSVKGLNLLSKGEIKRKIQEGAVEIDGGRITDIKFEIESGKEHRIRVGKKFARVFLVEPGKRI